MELLLILTALFANLAGLGAGDRVAAPISGVEAVRTSDESRIAAVAEGLAPSAAAQVGEAREADPAPAQVFAFESPPLYGDRPLE